MAWEIDAVHSEARFSVRQMASSDTIRGRFNAVRGYLHVDEQMPAHSWVDVEVGAASIDTGDEECDAHLRSKDVLDVAEYPTITFKSGRVEHVVGREYNVSGELTMHGVTRLVTFDARFEDHSDADGAGGVGGLGHAALTARATIDYRDFGVPRAGAAVEGQNAGRDLVGIEIDLALVSRHAESMSSLA